MDIEMFTAIFAGVVGVLAGAAGATAAVAKKTKNKVDDKVAKKLADVLDLAKKVPVEQLVALVKKLK